MENKLSKTINLLIKAGRSNFDDFQLKILLDPLKEGKISSVIVKNRKQFANTLSTEELSSLIKGLTIAEELFDLGKNPYSPVRWIFRESENRSIDESKKLANWILQNTSNRYLPYGWDNLGAKTLEEYHILSAEKQKDVEEYERKKQERIEYLEQLKINRAIQRKTSEKYRNTDVRKKFIADLSKKPILDQLKQLAYDEKFSVEFYPTKLAGQAQIDFLHELDRELQIALLHKLRGRRKGPWKRFKSDLDFLVNSPEDWILQYFQTKRFIESKEDNACNKTV